MQHSNNIKCKNGRQIIIEDQLFVCVRRHRKFELPRTILCDKILSFLHLTTSIGSVLIPKNQCFVPNKVTSMIQSFLTYKYHYFIKIMRKEVPTMWES